MTVTSGWRRLHPLSPILRSGKILLGISAGLAPQAATSGATVTVVLLGAAVPVLLIGAYLSWRRTRFTVEGAELHVVSGVLLHRERRVPLARVQAIDVVRPLVGRALGLAELRIEVVGGAHSEAPLAYLREAEAAQLRLELLALGRGEAAQADQPVQASTARTLVTVPSRALVGSTLLDGRVLLPIGLLLATAASATALPSRAVAGLGATVLAAGVTAFEVLRRRLLVEWGFTVSETADGLVLSHGLIETRSQTVPDGRVQGVRIIAPLLWRQRGWVRVEVDVAGYSGHGADLQTSTLLPVAPHGLAEALVARILGAHPPHAAVDGAGLVPPPPRARWLAPLSRHVLGLAADDRFVVTRTGWLRTSTAVVPLGKAQGLRLRQGPLQRRLGLASLHVDTAGRDIHAVALHRDAAEAARLLTDLADRARLRRTAAPAVLVPAAVRQDSSTTRT